MQQVIGGFVIQQKHHIHCSGEHDTAGNCVPTSGVDAFGRCLRCGSKDVTTGGCCQCQNGFTVYPLYQDVQTGF